MFVRFVSRGAGRLRLPRFRSCGVALICAGLLVMAWGCAAGSPPTAHVSDPRVFTASDLLNSTQAAHIVLHQVVTGSEDSDSISMLLAAYYRTPHAISRVEMAKAGAATQPACRLFDTLQTSQRQSGYVTIGQKLLAMNLMVAAAKAEDSATAQPMKDQLDRVRAEAASLLDAQMANQAYDSPFDQLDRTYDLFTLYLIKQITAYGDDRGIEWKKKVSEIQSPPNQKQHSRLLFLVFQATVETGQKPSPNQMVGVRLKVRSAELRDSDQGPLPRDQWSVTNPSPGAREAGADSSANWVKVLSLHPSRCYDLDATVQSTSEQQIMQASAQIQATLQGVPVQGGVQSISDQQAEARRRFVSRIGKTACYVNASEHTFGWNFYPCNLEVTEANIGERVWDWVLGDPSEHYKVKGYLDGGGRDCAVLLLVPSNLKSITFQTECVQGDIKHDQQDFRNVLRLAREAEKPEVMIVNLPPYDEHEASIEMPGEIMKAPAVQPGEVTSSLDKSAQN